MRGAREALAKLGPEAGKTIDLHFVWTKVLRGDTRAAALARAKEAEHAGVTHYWDETQALGKRFKSALGIEKGPLAWDVYVFFKAGVAWTAEVPPVAAWSHQLAGADPKRFFGGRLGPRLIADSRVARGLVAKSLAPVRTGGTITLDYKKLRTVAALMLDDALAVTRAELAAAERPAFDELAKRIRTRYAAQEAGNDFDIPKGIRLRGNIVAVPKPTCLPDQKK